MSPQVLFVLSSHAKVEGTPDVYTGWFLSELAHPYGALAPHAKIVIASPQGGEAPLNGHSIEMATDTESKRFLAEKRHVWESTEKLETFLGRAEEFEAIFFVGGAGPMFDLAESNVSHQIIREFHAAGKVVSAVCSGSAALAKVKLDDGTYLIAGQRVTGFSNAEEKDTGLGHEVPFFLETELKKNAGGQEFYESTAPWSPKVVVSSEHGKLITGQNPASAKPIAEAILAAISKA
ncbi:hypothetical protein LTR36_004977 [Oleoguttula mirabilis]|uniref:D-lactate dehydratase n=1 Tax=Oleoguttula mirabilis TaxID=1507867 RepID=A0AAV9JVP5_9PEZI|nr:hypothetical protein LTR36_004977 [Oleoguttula mirabilis]